MQSSDGHAACNLLPSPEPPIAVALRVATAALDHYNDGMSRSPKPSAQRPGAWRCFAILGGFAPASPKTHSFVVQDIGLCCILARAEDDLAWLQAELGVNPLPARERCEKIRAAIANKLWNADPHTPFCYDVVADKAICVPHASSLLALYGGCATAAQASALCDRISTLYEAPWQVPTMPPADPRFEAQRHWRGPVWVNVNWLVVDGLRRYGFAEHASALCESTVQMVEEHGFFEYYHPWTGEGLGAPEFSWSAALAWDLAELISQTENRPELPS